MSKPTKKIVMRKCAICGKKAKNKASKAAKKAAIKKQCKCVEKIALAKK